MRNLFEMKIAYFLTFVVSLVLADSNVEVNNDDFINGLKLKLEGLKVDLPEGLVGEFMAKLESGDERAGIVALVNDYVDRIMVNIRSAIIANGFDPMALPNNTLGFEPAAKIDLYSGWVQDTSSLARNGDVEVTYSSTTKNMELILPIKFNDLMFTYKYHTQALLLSISGDADGKVSDVDVKAKLSFNYETYHVTLDTFDITNSGKISLKFTGNSLVDWLTNAMTSVVTVFLHPVIIGIIQALVKGGLSSAVEAINSLLDSLFH